MGGAPNRAERFGWWRANVQYNDLVVQMLLNCKSGARGRSRLFIMCLIAFDKCKLTSWLIRQKYIINMESGVPVSRAGSGLQCFAFHRRLAIVDSASLHSVDVNKFLLLQTRFGFRATFSTKPLDNHQPSDRVTVLEADEIELSQQYGVERVAGRLVELGAWLHHSTRAAPPGTA